MDAGFELQRLERQLHADIALARPMQVRVLAADENGLVLGAPLEPNGNDKGTAFGGSLYSLAVLAGWALLSQWMRSRGIDCEVVIQESEVEYLQPVTADFQAKVRAPDDAALQRCLRTLARHGRARIEMEVIVESARVEAVRMRGRYVIT